MLIFDLDGTLTVPVLDFDAMRDEIGLPPGPILESLELLEGAAKEHALGVVHAHEERAAHNAQLQPNAIEVLSSLRQVGWLIGILTRNARRWANVILDQHGIEADILLAREDEPVKPSPEPILRMCAELSCSPSASWMIGDHLMDIQCGSSAGCRTVLMLGGSDKPDYSDQADHVIRVLDELLAIVGSPNDPA
ncbi:MAG: hydrolase [Phycisphaerae bacterium]|nr:MAG: hydrolase [Phycisphaerae bacterium]